MVHFGQEPVDEGFTARQDVGSSPLPRWSASTP